MAEATIPVDLRNPGQVFACLGLMEAAEILCGPTTGRFAYAGRETRTRFVIETAGDAEPVDVVLSFLEQATAVAVAPAGSDVRANEDGVETVDAPAGTYPCPAPETPSALPARLVGPDGRFLPITHWAEGSDVGRDNVKFRGGSGGYSGAALTRDALNLVRTMTAEERTAANGDPSAFARPQSSSFRFDWRRDYIPIDLGFSPNAHANVTMVGFPLVELLAAVGLEHARPLRPERRNKLLYRYGVSNVTLPTLLARAVLGAQRPGVPVRTFVMELGWPGQEDQARCITDAKEVHRDV
jgi:CRISPR-associated protein Csx14